MLDCQLKGIARKFTNVKISVIFTFNLWRVDIGVKSCHLLIHLSGTLNYP